MFIWIIHTDKPLPENGIFALPKNVVTSSAFKWLADAERFIEESYDGIFRFEWDKIEPPVKHSFVFKKCYNEYRPTNIWIERMELK